MDENYKKIIDEYKCPPTSKVLIINAIKEIKINKKNRTVWVISIVSAVICSIAMGFHNDTVILFKNAVELMLNIQIAMFGVLFTVYSILLSFLNNEFMKLLANSPKSDGKSQLSICTEYYENVLFLYFVCILFSLFVSLIMRCIPNEFRLTKYFVFDCLFASSLMFIFLVFSIRVLCEIKSTIYNTIVLFRTNVACRFVYFASEDEDIEVNMKLKEKELIIAEYLLKKMENEKKGEDQS